MEFVVKFRRELQSLNNYQHNKMGEILRNFKATEVSTSSQKGVTGAKWNLHITISGILLEVRKVIRFTREEKKWTFFQDSNLKIKLTFEIPVRMSIIQLTQM